METGSATFFLSTGRCGTQWFCDALATVYGDRAVVNHEPIQAAYHPRRYLRNAAALAAEPAVAAHLDQVAAILAQGRDYIETGWPCYPAVPLIAERFGPNVRFVHLVRNPVSVALSLASHQVYSRSDFVSAGALIPADPGVRQKELADRWAAMSDFEKTLFWWTEVNLYVEEVRAALPGHDFLAIRYEDFFDPLRDHPVHDLARFLGMPDRGRALDAHRARTVDQFRHLIPPTDWQRIRDYPETCALAARYGYDAAWLNAAAAEGAYDRYSPVSI